MSIDHATPAAFYAHQPERGMYYEIATDLPKTGFDFYAGAGFLQYKSKKDTAAASVKSILRDSGYVIIEGVEEFKEKAGEASKVVFMQRKGAGSSSLPYAIDRKETDLTLAQITENAVDYLSKNNDQGFFPDGGRR